MFAATKFWWYTARSSGIIAWLLCAGSVLFGLALSTKMLGRWRRPNWVLDLHRFFGGLSVIFVAVHILALVLDDFVEFGAVEVLIPFAGDWHPVAVGWGILAMYLLLIVEISSLLRPRLSKATWRVLHHLSFPMFALGLMHALWAGTDRKAFLMRYGFLVITAATLAMTARRLQRADRHDLMTSPPVAAKSR